MTARTCLRAVAAVALLVGSVLTSCANSDKEAAPSPSEPATSSQSAPVKPSSSAEPQTPVQFRLVAASTFDPAGASGGGEPVPGLLEVDCSDPPPVPASNEVGLLCDAEDVVYAVEPAIIVGGVEDAEAVSDEPGGWLVNLQLDPKATAQFADLSRQIVGTDQQFAIVLDGQVLTAPTMAAVITNGEAQISGDFTEEEAMTLATRLVAGG